MRKFYLLTLLAFLPLLANADAVEIDGIYYNLNDQVHRAEVTVNPNGYFGEVSIASFISYDGSLYNVTSIGNLAFANCTTLTNVTIPLIVTSIGENAFKDCVGLTYVNIPCNVSSIGSCAFSGCNQLTDVYCNVGSVPNTETDAFSNVPINQVTLHVPAGSVEAYQAASPWSGFKEVVPIETKKTIDVETAGTLSTLIPVGEKYLIEELTLTGNLNGDDLALLRDMAGNNKNGQATPGILTTLDMSGANIVAGGTYAQFTEGVVQIRLRWKNGPQEINGSYWIMDSPEGADAHISTANTIGAFLFAGCGSLETVKLPNTLISLEDRAFSFTQLKSIIIPTPVESIEPGAFSDDPLITSIAVDPENAKYESPNNNCIIEKSSHTLIVGCNDMVIPADKGLISIGNNAFGGRMFLTRMDIPEGITTIGNAVFRECRLISVTLPSTLESLGSWALGWNYNTTDVYCKAKTVPTTDVSAFEGSNMENVTLHVPAGSVDAYKAASPWSGFKEVKAIETKKTIDVETAGTLSTLIPVGEKYLIEELTLTGNLNGDDLALLRDMAGSDYNGFPTDGKLSFLDMSGATIVAGGKYVELVDENIYYNREIGNFHGGFDKDPQVSEANTLGKNVFAGCSKLETMIMPTGVVTVGERAFSDTSLKDIVWPTSLATIGYEAFFGCKFTSFTLPASVESVGGNILKYCSTLELSVESGNSNYDSRDNCNAIIETSTNTLIGGCKNTIIPNSVTSIGVEAFCGCASGLLSLTIPSSVTSIGYDAFEACSDLVHVYCNAEVVPTTDADAFKNVDIRNRVTLHVPAGSVEAYQAAAPWSGFNKVVALSTNIPDVEILGIYYNLNEETLTAEVTKNPNGPYSGDLIVGGGIWYDSRLYSVTSIGKDAFALNGGITSVSIQEGVTTIGEGAFGYCPYLTSVTFPSSLISIGGAAFYGCERLTSVTIPANVTSISDNSFRSCKSLASIQVEDGNTKYDSRNDCNAIIEKENNTLISGCKNTVIPDNVTSIGVWAFEGISGLTSVTIPNSVTSIGAWSFAGTGLTSLAIPASVTTIDNDAFTNCSNLASIQVADGNTTFDSRDNSKAIIETATNTLIRASNTTVIPSSVSSIGYRAFGGSGITSITIPSTITSIEYMAFAQCKDLESISVESGNTKYDSRNNCNAIIETETNTLIAGCKNTITPNTVTSIGEHAFLGIGLTSVTIPSSVTSIDLLAFWGNIELRDVYCLSAEVPTTDATAFDDCFINDATLHVLAGCVETYQAASPWSGFKEVVAIDTKKVINVETAGTLPTLIPETEKYLIEDLTLTGNLNGTDFRLIREMAGNDYLGQPTNGVLKKLDISGANIVEGGDMYLDAQNMQIGSSTWSGSDYHKSTNDNILGAFLFAGCKALEEIKLPSTITTIEYNAFWYCTSLKGLEIPKSVRGIYSSAISDCTSLESLVVESGNSNYKSDNCNAVISGTTLLIGCKNTVIPDYITEIGNNAFFGCSGFKGNNGTLTLPIGLKSISAYGFADCSFSSIVLPNGLEKIDYSAFARNHALTAITIPASVTYIGRSILEDCTNLNSIVIADGNTVYDSRDNCNAIIETATNKLIEGFENTVIPTTVTTIGEDAYYQCLWLKEVTIPGHITSIEQRAYWNCQNLKDVYCYIKVPFAITTDVFWNLPNTAVLHVPSGTKPLYEATEGWKDVFSGRIYEINPVVINVTTAGTLSTLISDAEKYTIEELTITGNLNGTDFRLIREMAGNDYLGQPTNGVLKKLDISGANIVEGGEKYLDTDNMTSSTGSYTYKGGEFFHFTTQNNVLGNSLFAGCDKLEEVVLPNSITSIGEYVFWYCLNLRALEIPENVSSIGSDFVYGPNQLGKLTVAEGNQTYSSPANSNALMQGSKLVFGISSTQIPTGTTVIGSNAFANCNFVNNQITLPGGVTTIESSAFSMSNVSVVNMPSTLTTIGSGAFAVCWQLESFTLPKSVTSIDGSALAHCSYLTELKVEDGNPVYDSRENCNAIIETATNKLVCGSMATVIPESVTSIGDDAFRESQQLSSFMIPNWIYSIGERTFMFGGLESVTIPSSVVSIGALAFAWNNKLESVIVESKTPLIISDNVFTDQQNMTLYVPAGSINAYKAADYWKDFGAIYSSVTSLFDGTNLWTSYVAQEDYAIPAGLEAYVISSLSETSAVASQIDYIPQGVPILLKRNDVTANSFDFTTGTGTAPTTNLLKVYNTDKTVANREGYILFKDEFVLVDEGTLPAGKVFLPLNGGNSANTRGIVIEGEGTTGIQNLVSDSEVSHGVWYDLQGRKIDGKPIKKGVYILNGRKVVVK